MVFSSWEFIGIFLVVALGGLQLMKSLQSKLVWLTLCSYGFYGFAGAQYTLLLLLISSVDFYAGKRIAAAGSLRARRGWLALSIGSNLAVLAFFKYANFIWRNALDLLAMADSSWGTVLATSAIHALQYESIADAETFLKFVLPPGISFYTFQSMSYTLDVYWNKTPPERRYWKFACFVSVFPHLIAGPIVRYVELAPQMDHALMRPKTVTDWEAGVLRFSIGLCKKVLIADRIGNAIDPLLANFHQLDMVTAWMVMIGFAYQLYFDFSGYSDMAVGLGKMLGVELPVNFDSPYRALNPSDFWQRWHITLSRWLRDYLYVPLGGNRGGRLRTLRNLLLTMLLGGLWHGAGWTFVIWGAFHGLLLIAYRLGKTWWDSLRPSAARSLMFLLVVIAWVPFRAEDFGMMREVLAAMFGLKGVAGGLAAEIPAKLYLELAVAGAIAHFCPVNSNRFSYHAMSPLQTMALAIATVVALASMNISSKFLYFNF